MLANDGWNVSFGKLCGSLDITAALSRWIRGFCELKTMTMWKQFFQRQFLVSHCWASIESRLELYMMQISWLDTSLKLLLSLICGIFLLHIYFLLSCWAIPKHKSDLAIQSRIHVCNTKCSGFPTKRSYHPVSSVSPLNDKTHEKAVT